MLVSAIMPTKGRPDMAARALECWLSQTWEEKEIIILDDSAAPSFEYEPAGNGIFYARTSHKRMSALRNAACMYASGEIIVHFDDDDWYSPGYIADKVEALVSSGRAVTQYRNITFTDGTNRWLNTNWPGGYGATLAYRREWWQKHQFTDRHNTEDWNFAMDAATLYQLIVCDAHDYMYMTIHPGNNSPRVIGEGWVKLD